MSLVPRRASRNRRAALATLLTTALAAVALPLATTATAVPAAAPIAAIRSALKYGTRNGATAPCSARTATA
ncbi:hypothetical protein GCM10010301_72440 [Streptomyces plicatus]|nr:hypothetical protein GCM10010301_72440 [Streptomyces plicatus]